MRRSSSDLDDDVVVVTTRVLPSDLTFREVSTEGLLRLLSSLVGFLLLIFLLARLQTAPARMPHLLAHETGRWLPSVEEGDRKTTYIYIGRGGHSYYH